MEIKDINFDILESVRKKCITFAKDGNTVVKPYKTLYNVEQITHNAEHCNLYFEVVNGKESWEQDSYCVWDNLGNFCIKIDWIPRYWTLEEFAEKLHKWKYYGIDGFFKCLKVSEENGYHISKADIEICAVLGEIELAKHYAEYREERIRRQEEKRQAVIAEREAKEREEEEKHNAEVQKTIENAVQKIFHQNELENIKIDGKSIVNYLMKEYGIKVPLRTQGWINSKLAMIIFNDGKISYKFYGKSQKDNSTVFRKYLVELETAIYNEWALPFS